MNTSQELLSLLAPIVLIIVFVLVIGYFRRKWHKEGALPGYDPVTGLTSIPKQVAGYAQMQKQGKSLPMGMGGVTGIILVLLGGGMLAISLSLNKTGDELISPIFFLVLGAWMCGAWLFYKIVKDAQQQKRYGWVILAPFIGILGVSFFLMSTDQDSSTWWKALLLFLIIFLVPLISFKLQKKDNKPQPHLP